MHEHGGDESGPDWKLDGMVFEAWVEINFAGSFFDGEWNMVSARHSDNQFLRWSAQVPAVSRFIRSDSVGVCKGLPISDLSEIEEDIGEDQGIGHPGGIFGGLIVTDGNDHDGFLGASEKKILERCEIHRVSISLER